MTLGHRSSATPAAKKFCTAARKDKLAMSGALRHPFLEPAVIQGRVPNATALDELIQPSEWRKTTLIESEIMN